MFHPKSKTAMDHNFDLILKYLRGDATLDERLRVMEWVKESDANRKELQALRRIYDALLISEDDFAEEKTVRRTKLRRFFVGIGSAVAAAAAAVGIFFMTSRHPEKQQELLQVSSICAPFGYQTETVLSDGTRIRLNSGSRLEILPDSTGRRLVRLDGEAYFDVAHDELRPFVLETSGMEVKVLGTVFNVTAYDGIQSVVLVEGRVEAKGIGAEESVVIEPSRKYEYDMENGTGNVEVIDTEEYTSWIDGYMLLKEMPLPEILDRLEHYFGVEIVCDADFRNVKVTGKLMLDGGVGTALETLALMAPMKYEDTGSDRITVSAKGK